MWKVELTNVKVHSAGAALQVLCTSSIEGTAGTNLQATSIPYSAIGPAVRPNVRIQANGIEYATQLVK